MKFREEFTLAQIIKWKIIKVLKSWILKSQEIIWNDFCEENIDSIGWRKEYERNLEHREMS